MIYLSSFKLSNKNLKTLIFILIVSLKINTIEPFSFAPITISMEIMVVENLLF